MCVGLGDGVVVHHFSWTPMLLSSSGLYWDTNRSEPARASNRMTTTTASTNMMQLLSLMNNITNFEQKRYIPYQYCNGLTIQLCKGWKNNEWDINFVPALLTFQLFGIKYNPPTNDMPKWRNWQTRYVQGVVNLRSWGFKSLLRHHRDGTCLCRSLFL